MLVLVRNELTRRFGHVQEMRVQEISVGEIDVAGQDEPVVAEEMRLLATRGPARERTAATAVAGAAAVADRGRGGRRGRGWAAISPPLVPGETFAYAARDFRVQYAATSLEAVEEEGAERESLEAQGQRGVPALALRLQHGEAIRDLPLTQPETRLTLDGVRVRALVVAPALLVRTADGSNRLVAPRRQRPA